ICRMSLSLIAPRVATRATLQRVIVLRAAHSTAVPPPATKQVTVSGVAGHFKYDRDWSRDKRYSAPQKLGDTPMRFLVRRLGHAYEIYPLFILTGAWFLVFCYTVYYSFEKMEIWLDRSKDSAPWDWERIKNNYWKKPTLVFDSEGVTHQRVELMEVLQNEMVAAAKARGTR
ncbi:hypothetical protein PFISCL1PPCAC_20622, partial [Pristionchus fissidentatus]